MNILRSFFSDSGNRIARTFDLMKIADEEARRSRHPDAFLLLFPTDPFLVARGQTDRVYRSHCRELLERLECGEDTRPGTDAELLLAMSESSLRAPLTSWATALMEWLFRRVLPDVELEGESAGRELYAGQIAEEALALRKKLAADWRAPGRAAA